MSSGGSSKLDSLLNEIDDNEFDIPAVENAPSLESILESRDDELATIDCGNVLHDFAAASPGHAHQIFSVLTTFSFISFIFPG